MRMLHAALQLFVLYAHCSKKSQWLALLTSSIDLSLTTKDWCSVLFPYTQGAFRNKACDKRRRKWDFEPVVIQV